MVLTQHICSRHLYHKRRVSIPLWFSRNALSKIRDFCNDFGFHTTMVLTQLKERRDVEEILKAFPYHYGSHATGLGIPLMTREDVSIPLWFSRNMPRRMSRTGTHTFPYHYGSHATRRALIREAIQHKFPYHYGSHATKGLWRRLCSSPQCFHTTMVLTQHR